ncbi:branched-chain amino acid ABC transporter permease [Pollutimonas sp. M17]|uniref:branched-chain amino acid ABC transporter permease n=1 Tax=Pollutimonas sp. M17 TaxID=2962065 RepID=UPI0021F49D03|nr:branched-chain amino acid ABC transporter permease [Pollutimonas sp. M17]UYO94151.1 branched-chain amino acid ABC transporter permease [Pollutimonas sp. M17]
MKTRFLWSVIGLVLLAAVPVVLSQGLVNAAIPMLIAALFACAYNLLCGQAGMLSFGHSAYFGVGAFSTIHAMNALGGAGLLPTPLMPLAGAAGGLIFGAAAGWFATQRTGTYFAMITLAIAELIHALAPHLKGVFGGEAGLSSMRMPAWGFTFGTTNEVYYLTLVWVALCLALLYLITRTPLGRLALGVRENSHRLSFLGYEVHRINVLIFAISGMFSGVAGALQVVSNEAANYVVFDPSLSAAVVLNTYIGGVNVFLGPALGAALMTFFGYAVSDMTQSWLLYQGLLFVLVMMFMPTGLSGLAVLAASSAKRHGIRAVAPAAALYLAAFACLTAAIVFLTELLGRVFSQDYKALSQAAGSGELPSVLLFGWSWSPASPLTWVVPLALMVLGIACWRLASGSMRRHAAAGAALHTGAAGAAVQRRPA